MSTAATFIDRFLRRLPGTDIWFIFVNDEAVADVVAATEAEARVLAEARCEQLERDIDDFRVEIIEHDEPELGCTHTVKMIAHGSGRLLEQFTTDDPYGAVEAAREAQAYSLEERFEMYAEMGL